MYAPSTPLGKSGLMPDLPEHQLPLGGWANGRNIRFNDGFMERIREPLKTIDLIGTGKWFQLYEDSTGPRVVYATDTNLYRLNIAQDAWEDVTNPTHVSYTPGRWTSFQWGTAVVFNNGIEPPQILLAGATEFADLQNWGLTTSGQKTVRANVLRAFGNFMWAINLEIDGIEKPNAVWISGPGVDDNDDSNFFQPSWDYEDPGSSSIFTYQGAEHGPLVDALPLNNNMILYSNASAYIAQLIGGANPWSFIPSVEYGLIDIGSVVQFTNYHFCVGPDTIYVHDGSVVTHIADAVIQRDFYRRLSDRENITGAENLETKEVHMQYTTADGREYLIFNYKDGNFGIGDATVGAEACIAMAYDLDSGGVAETYDSILTTYDTEPRSYNDMAGAAGNRTMFWLTDMALYRAEISASTDAMKQYFVDSPRLDFSEINPVYTADRWKELMGIYPHIDGTALTEFTFTSVSDIRGNQQSTEVVPFDPAADYKADCRLMGRYIGVRIKLTGDGDWRMSSLDYNLGVVHGQ